MCQYFEGRTLSASAEATAAIQKALSRGLVSDELIAGVYGWQGSWALAWVWGYGDFQKRGLSVCTSFLMVVIPGSCPCNR
jgi:hypothetical protein